MLFPVLADDIRLQFNNDPIVIVFDNDYGNHKAVEKIHSAWRERSGHPGFSIFPKGGVPWDCIPLQCADLVAGLLRVNPFSLAMLNRRLNNLGDDDPVSDIAGLALNNGRGAMWSASISDEVEAFLRRMRWAHAFWASFFSIAVSSAASSNRTAPSCIPGNTCE